MIKVAVYSIALNEIKHAERYAEATKGADYVIVADTGSTDGTQDRLRELGITVYDITVKPWRFDAARNAALALVPADADVCVILDMDEVPDPKFFEKVRKGWTPGANLGWITMDTGAKWQRDRLHSREGWFWKYPCHEVQIYYGEKEPFSCQIHEAIIKHEPDMTKSRGQYLPLLEMSVKQYPEDARMWAYMTREYFFYREWDKVLMAGEKQLSLGGWVVETAAVCRWMGEAAHQLGKNEYAQELYERGLKSLPLEGEPWFGVAMDAYRRKDWQRCLDASINALERPRSPHHCYEPDVWDWKAYDLASIASYELGFASEALAFCREAMKANGPEQERISKNYEFFKRVVSNAPARTKGKKVGAKRKV